MTNWNAFSQIWAERLIAVVWQSTVLTLVIALAVALLLRRSSPAVRYWVWQILAIKLLIMPFWAWAIPWRAPLASDEPSVASIPARPVDRESHTDDSPASEAGPMNERTSRPSSPVESSPTAAVPPALPRVTWQGWLLLAWGAIVLAQVIRLFVQRRRLSRLLETAAPAGRELADLVSVTAGKVGLRRTPQTLIARSDFSPFVCGIGRPKLILPDGLSDKLTHAELMQVLLHELAHIRRQDLIWSWVGEIARIVYFFHPIAHWISYQARLERELACDQLAMAVSGHGPNDYAATLVQVVSHASEPSVFKTAASASLQGDGP
ncbi:MAG: M48 family metalloprotease [Planctomycetia bacterium]|nr:M48 family metalloprotease [Planctomycetia bacterium]